MFAKLKTTKYLMANANGEQAEVVFTPAVQRLARVHHYGLRDRVYRRGTQVKYAKRALLGFNNNTYNVVECIVYKWLSK